MAKTISDFLARFLRVSPSGEKMDGFFRLGKVSSH